MTIDFETATIKYLKALNKNPSDTRLEKSRNNIMKQMMKLKMYSQARHFINTSAKIVNDYYMNSINEICKKGK